MAESANCSLITDCASCDGSGCLVCRVGYSPNNDGSACLKNGCSVADCLYCAVDGSCLRCLSGFNLNTNVCSPAACPLSNCQTCKTHSKFCDECASGFMLNVWSGLCESHAINVTNCASFMIDSSNQLKCVRCGGGLVPSADGLTCVVNCPSDCAACSDSLTCTTCKTGFTLASGNCSKNNCTHAHCTLCAADQTCSACDAHSALSNGSCVVTCSAPHCLLCLHGSSECELCAEGYSLNTWNNECIPSPISGCLKVVDFSQQ